MPREIRTRLPVIGGVAISPIEFDFSRYVSADRADAEAVEDAAARFQALNLILRTGGLGDSKEITDVSFFNVQQNVSKIIHAEGVSAAEIGAVVRGDLAKINRMQLLAARYHRFATRFIQESPDEHYRLATAVSDSLRKTGTSADDMQLFAAMCTARERISLEQHQSVLREVLAEENFSQAYQAVLQQGLDAQEKHWEYIEKLFSGDVREAASITDSVSEMISKGVRRLADTLRGVDRATDTEEANHLLAGIVAEFGLPPVEEAAGSSFSAMLGRLAAFITGQPAEEQDKSLGRLKATFQKRFFTKALEQLQTVLSGERTDFTAAFYARKFLQRVTLIEQGMGESIPREWLPISGEPLSYYLRKAREVCNTANRFELSTADHDEINARVAAVEAEPWPAQRAAKERLFSEYLTAYQNAKLQVSDRRRRGGSETSAVNEKRYAALKLQALVERLDKTVKIKIAHYERDIDSEFKDRYDVLIKARILQYRDAARNQLPETAKLARQLKYLLKKYNELFEQEYVPTPANRIVTETLVEIARLQMGEADLLERIEADQEWGAAQYSDEQINRANTLIETTIAAWRRTTDPEEKTRLARQVRCLLELYQQTFDQAYAEASASTSIFASFLGIRQQSLLEALDTGIIGLVEDADQHQAAIKWGEALSGVSVAANDSVVVTQFEALEEKFWDDLRIDLDKSYVRNALSRITDVLKKTATALTDADKKVLRIAYLRLQYYQHRYSGLPYEFLVNKKSIERFATELEIYKHRISLGLSDDDLSREGEYQLRINQAQQELLADQQQYLAVDGGRANQVPAQVAALQAVSNWTFDVLGSDDYCEGYPAELIHLIEGKRQELKAKSHILINSMLASLEAQTATTLHPSYLSTLGLLVRGFQLVESTPDLNIMLNSLSNIRFVEQKYDAEFYGRFLAALEIQFEKQIDGLYTLKQNSERTGKHSRLFVRALNVLASLLGCEDKELFVGYYSNKIADRAAAIAELKLRVKTELARKVEQLQTMRDSDQHKLETTMQFVDPVAQMQAKLLAKPAVIEEEGMPAIHAMPVTLETMTTMTWNNSGKAYSLLEPLPGSYAESLYSLAEANDLGIPKTPLQLFVEYTLRYGTADQCERLADLYGEPDGRFKISLTYNPDGRFLLPMAVADLPAEGSKSRATFIQFARKASGLLVMANYQLLGVEQLKEKIAGASSLSSLLADPIMRAGLDSQVGLLAVLDEIQALPAKCTDELGLFTANARQVRTIMDSVVSEVTAAVGDARARFTDLANEILKALAAEMAVIDSFTMRPELYQQLKQFVLEHADAATKAEYLVRADVALIFQQALTANADAYFSGDKDTSKLNSLFYSCLTYVDDKPQEEALFYFNNLTKRLADSPAWFDDKWDDNASFITWLTAADLQPIDSITNPQYRDLVRHAQVLTGVADVRAWLHSYVGTTLLSKVGVERNKNINPLLQAVIGADFASYIAQDQARAVAISRLLINCLRSPADHPLDGSAGVLMSIPISADKSIDVENAEQLLQQVKWLGQQSDEVLTPVLLDELNRSIAEFIGDYTGSASLDHLTTERLKLLAALEMRDGVKARFADGSEHDVIGFIALQRLQAIYNNRACRNNFRPGESFGQLCDAYSGADGDELFARDQWLFEEADYSDEFDVGIQAFLATEISSLSTTTDEDTYDTLVYLIGRYGADEQRKLMASAYEKFAIDQLEKSDDKIEQWKSLAINLGYTYQELAGEDKVAEFDALLTTSLIVRLTALGGELTSDSEDVSRKNFDRFYYFCLHALPFHEVSKVAKVWLQYIIKLESDSDAIIQMVYRSNICLPSGKLPLIDELVQEALASDDVTALELSNLMELAVNFADAESIYALLTHQLSAIVEKPISATEVTERWTELLDFFDKTMAKVPDEEKQTVLRKLNFTWLPSVVSALMTELEDESQRFDVLFEFALRRAKTEQVFSILKENLEIILADLDEAEDEARIEEEIDYVLATRRDFSEEYQARLISWLARQDYPVDSVQYRAIMRCVTKLETAAGDRLAEHVMRVAEAHASGEHSDPAAAIAEYRRYYQAFSVANKAMQWRVIAAAADNNEITAVRGAIAEWGASLFSRESDIPAKAASYLDSRKHVGRIVVTRYGTKPASWQPVVQCISSAIAGSDDGLSKHQRDSFVNWLVDRLRYPDMAAAQQAEDPTANAENESILAKLISGELKLDSFDAYLELFTAEQLAQIVQASALFILRTPTAEERPLRDLLQRMFADDSALMRTVRPAMTIGRVQHDLELKQAELAAEQAKWFKWARPAVLERIAELEAEVAGLQERRATLSADLDRPEARSVARAYHYFEYHNKDNLLRSSMLDYLRDMTVFDQLDQIQAKLATGSNAQVDFRDLSNVEPSLPIGNLLFVDRLQQLIGLAIEKGWSLTGVDQVIGQFPRELSDGAINPVRARLERGVNLDSDARRAFNANYAELIHAIDNGLAVEDDFEIMFVSLANLDRDQLTLLVEFLSPERKLILQNKFEQLQDKLATKAPYLSDRLALLVDILHPAAKADASVRETESLLTEWHGLNTDNKLLAAVGKFFATEGDLAAKTTAFNALKPDEVRSVADSSKMYWQNMIDKLLAEEALDLVTYFVENGLATAEQAERLEKMQQANQLADQIVAIVREDNYWKIDAEPSALSKLQEGFADIDDLRLAIASMMENLGVTHREKLQSALSSRCELLLSQHDELRVVANRQRSDVYQAVGGHVWQALVELAPAVTADMRVQLQKQAKADVGVVRRRLITIKDLLDPTVYPLAAGALLRDSSFLAEAIPLIDGLGTAEEKHELAMRFDLMFESYLTYVTTPRASVDEDYCSSLETLLTFDSRYETTVKSLQRLRRANPDDRRPYLDACYAELAKLPIMSELLCDYSRMRDQLALAIQNLALAVGFSEEQVFALIAFRDYMVENQMSHVENIRAHYDAGKLPVELARMYTDYFSSSNTVLHVLIEISAQLIVIGRESNSGEALAGRIAELAETFTGWHRQPVIALAVMTNLRRFLGKLQHNVSADRQTTFDDIGFSQANVNVWQERLDELRSNFSTLDCADDAQFRVFFEALRSLVKEVDDNLAVDSASVSVADQEVLAMAKRWRKDSEAEFTRDWLRNITKRLEQVKENALALTEPQARYASSPEPVRTLQVRIAHARSIVEDKPVNAIARLYQVHCAVEQLGIVDGLTGIPADIEILNQEVSAANSFYQELTELLTRLIDEDYARYSAAELQVSRLLVGKRFILSEAQRIELQRLQGILVKAPHAVGLAAVLPLVNSLCACATTLPHLLEADAVVDPVTTLQVRDLNLALGGSRLIARWLGSLVELTSDLANTRLTMLTASEISQLKAVGFFATDISPEWTAVYRNLFRSIGDCDVYLEAAAVHRLTDVVAELMPEALQAEYLASMQTLARKYIEHVLADIKVHTDHLRTAGRDPDSVQAIARLIADLSEGVAPYNGAMLVITEYATAEQKQALARHLNSLTRTLVGTYRVACYSPETRHRLPAGLFEQLARAVPAIVRLPQQLKLDEETALVARDDKLMVDLKAFEKVLDSNKVKGSYSDAAMHAEQANAVPLAGAITTEADSFHKLYFSELMLSRAPSRRLLETLISAVVATVPPDACEIEGLQQTIQEELLKLVDNPDLARFDAYIETLKVRSRLTDDQQAHLETRANVLRAQLIQYATAAKINHDVFKGDSLGLQKVFLRNALQANRVLRTPQQAYRWQDYEAATLKMRMAAEIAREEDAIKAEIRTTALRIGTDRGDAASSLMETVMHTAQTLTIFNDEYAEEIATLEQEQARQNEQLAKQIATVTARIQEYEAVLKPGSGRSGLSLDIARSSLPRLRDELTELEASRGSISSPRLVELLAQSRVLAEARDKAQAELNTYSEATRKLVTAETDRLNTVKDDKVASLRVQYAEVIANLSASFASHFAEHKAAIKKAILAIEIDGTAKDRESLANLFMMWNTAVSVAVKDEVAKLRSSSDHDVQVRIARVTGSVIDALNQEKVAAIHAGNDALANKLELPTVREARIIEAIAREFGLDQSYGAEMQAVIIAAQREAAALIEGIESKSSATVSKASAAEDRAIPIPGIGRGAAAGGAGGRAAREAKEEREEAAFDAANQFVGSFVPGEARDLMAKRFAGKTPAISEIRLSDKSQPKILTKSEMTLAKSCGAEYAEVERRLYGRGPRGPGFVPPVG